MLSTSDIVFSSLSLSCSLVLKNGIGQMIEDSHGVLHHCVYCVLRWSGSFIFASSHVSCSTSFSGPRFSWTPSLLTFLRYGTLFLGLCGARMERSIEANAWTEGFQGQVSFHVFLLAFLSSALPTTVGFTSVRFALGLLPFCVRIVLHWDRAICVR